MSRTQKAVCRTQSTQSFWEVWLYRGLWAWDRLQDFLSVCTCVLSCVFIKPYKVARRSFVHKVHKVHDFEIPRAQARLACLAYKGSVYKELHLAILNPISLILNYKPP